MKLKEIKDMIGGISNTFDQDLQTISSFKQMIGLKTQVQPISEFTTQPRIDSRWPQERLEELKRLSSTRLKTLRSPSLRRQSNQPSPEGSP